MVKIHILESTLFIKTVCCVSSCDDLSLIIKLFYFCTQLLQSVEWKNKSVNCTIGSFSDIIHAVVLSDIFPLVSLFFTHPSATISFHCSFKVIVTEALRVGPVFFRPIKERGKA